MTWTADFNTGSTVPFQRMRALISDNDVQEGVVGANDLKVTTAGTNMVVNVSTGAAYVQIDTGTRNGLGHVYSDAVSNVTIAASNGTNPRVDQIVVRWNESTIPTGSGDIPTPVALTGTATSGATLDNRTGALALPNDCMRLADILVPAASSTVTTANIRDRRGPARAGHWWAASDNTAITVGAQAPARVNSGALEIRMEIPAAASFVAVMAHFEVDAVTTNFNHQAQLVRNAARVSEPVQDAQGQAIPGLLVPSATAAFSDWLVDGAANGNVAGTYAQMRGAGVNATAGLGYAPWGLTPIMLLSPGTGTHLFDLYHGGTGGNTVVRNRRLWVSWTI